MMGTFLARGVQKMRMEVIKVTKIEMIKGAIELQKIATSKLIEATMHMIVEKVNWIATIENTFFM